jgi:hypothetical protein
MKSASQPDSLDAINRDVVALWQSRFAATQPPVRWPLIHPPFDPSGLLAVGCNPSFPAGGDKKIPWFAEGQDSEKEVVALSDPCKALTSPQVSQRHHQL